jgi:hypothetical protein
MVRKRASRGKRTTAASEAIGKPGSASPGKAASNGQERRTAEGTGGRPAGSTGPPVNGQGEAPPSIFAGFFSAAELQEQAVEFLWEPWVPRKGLTLLAGLPEMGKTTLLAALVADVAGGPRLAGGHKRRHGKALLLAGEEDYASMTQPRLIAAGADPNRVKLFGQRHPGEKVEPLRLPAHLDRLEQFVREQGIGLIAFDPISRYADPGKDFNNELAVREVLDGLQLLSFRCDCPVLITRNLKKDKTGELLDRINGSAAFRDVPRSIIYLVEHPHIPGQKVIVHAKCSVAEKAKSRAFDLPRMNDVPRFRLLGEAGVTVQDAAESLTSVGARAEWRAAHLLVRGVIGNEWVESKKLLEKAREEGITPSTIWRAGAELKVQRRKVGAGPGSHWEVGPPKDGWPKDLIS